MNASAALIASDGQNIQQITYNQSHDLQPVVLQSGKIAFLRWDAAEGRDQLSLYSVNPDGSEMNFLYGFHNQNTVGGQDATFFDLAELPNNRLLAILKRRSNGDDGTEFPVLGGDLITIDTENFTEINQPTDGGQTSISPATIAQDETNSEAGYYNSAFPLDDGTNRLLVTWSPCRISAPGDDTILLCTPDNLAIAGVTEANPFYGLWVFDPSDQTQKPIVVPEEGEMFTDIVALAPRAIPPILTDLNDTSGYGTYTFAVSTTLPALPTTPRETFPLQLWPTLGKPPIPLAPHDSCGSSKPSALPAMTFTILLWSTLIMISSVCRQPVACDKSLVTRLSSPMVQ